MRIDSVNPQTTDALTQTVVTVVGEAPTVALANYYLATSQALSNAAHTATDTLQNSVIIHQSATAQAVNSFYTVDTGASTASLVSILENLK